MIVEHARKPHPFTLAVIGISFDGLSVTIGRYSDRRMAEDDRRLPTNAEALNAVTGPAGVFPADGRHEFRPPMKF